MTGPLGGLEDIPAGTEMLHTYRSRCSPSEYAVLCLKPTLQAVVLQQPPRRRISRSTDVIRADVVAVPVDLFPSECSISTPSLF